MILVLTVGFASLMLGLALGILAKRCNERTCAPHRHFAKEAREATAELSSRSIDGRT